MRIEGYSALITGGASGLGEATARLLARQGASVVILDLNEETGRNLAAELNGIFVKCDVTSSEQVRDAVEAARNVAPLWSVVNCAGIAWAQRTIGRDSSYSSAHDLDSFRKVIEINLTGTFNVCRLAAAAMSRNEIDDDGCRGAIVNTASVAAQDGQIGQAAYSSSKAGILGLTLPLARDLSVAGIRVNCVLPGLIDTPIYAFAEDPVDFKRRLGQDVLFPKRLGLASEFASMALELLTNSYMNAASVRVDAGVRLPPR